MRIIHLSILKMITSIVFVLFFCFYYKSTLARRVNPRYLSIYLAINLDLYLNRHS